VQLVTRLKAARTAAKLTQAQLAEAVGVDPATISLLERGKRQRRGVSHAIAVSLAAVLRVDVNELFPALRRVRTNGHERSR
jgi:transcriptional regulator with XRE-family HTH domain